MRTTPFLATIFTAALLCAPALAEGRHGHHAGVHDEGPGLEPMAEGSRLGFGTDIWSTSGALVATMGVTGQFEVARGVMIDVDVPWAAGNFSSGSSSETTGGFGNITAGAHGVFKLDRDAALHIGGTISVPTRYDYTSAGTDYIFFMAAADMSRGGYDMHRLLPGVLSLRVPFGVELRFAKYFHFRGDLNPVVLIPVAKGASGDPQVVLEHADEIEGRAPFGLGIGLRFQAAFALTNFGGQGFLGGDHAQTAMEPFLQYEPRGSGFYGRLGTLLALDTPLGPAAEAGKLATIKVSVGGKF